MNKLQGKIPQIRFPGFKDAWEQKAIGDVFKLNVRPIPKPLANYKSIGIRSHFKGTFQRLDSDPSKNVMDTLFEVKENDLIVNITFAWEGAVAIASKDDERGLVSHRFPTYINDKKKVDIDFFRFLFPTSEFKRTLTLISPGSAGRNRVLKKSDFLKIKFLFPSLPEQTRIASFFTVFDKKITQLKQKKTLLEQYKKGVMQKLFSQEIRFKDENGKEFPKWEKKKLGELGEFVGGGTPTTKDNSFWNGDIPWLSSSDLAEDSIYRLFPTSFITKEAFSKSATKLIPPKSILIISRVGVGKVAINDVGVCTSQDFTNLIPKKDNHLFLAYLIKQQTEKLLGFNQGTSIKGFVKSDLADIKILLPSIKEQTKIANFLSAIDEKINRTENQIQQTQEYKKGLLQKMFC